MAKTQKTPIPIVELVAGLDPELKAQFEESLAVLEDVHEKKQQAALESMKAALGTEHQTALKTALQEQSDKFSEELSDALQNQADEHEAATAELRSELEALKEKYGAATKEIPGTYKADNGRTYKFADGTFKFIFDGKEHSSKEALQDDDLMEDLIEMGCGFLVEVLEQEKSEED